MIKYVYISISKNTTITYWIYYMNTRKQRLEQFGRLDIREAEKISFENFNRVLDNPKNSWKRILRCQQHYDIPRNDYYQQQLVETLKNKYLFWGSSQFMDVYRDDTYDDESSDTESEYDEQNHDDDHIDESDYDSY